VYLPVLSTVPPAEPSWTDQVTEVDWPALVPVTAAVNVSEPPGAVSGTCGVTETAITSGSTATVAVSELAGSSTLVATTWNVPGEAGAEYTPAELTVPPALSWTDQVTACDCAPVTLAAKEVVLPGWTEAVCGTRLTLMADCALPAT
jgi:hypothetical protein